MTNQSKIIAAIIVALVVAGVGVALVRGAGFLHGAQTIAELASSTAPSLTDRVNFSSDLSPEAKQSIQKTIDDLRAKLAKNYRVYEEWLTLAIRYKQAGDYDKARAVWEYLLVIHPEDPVTLHNLGDLYHHFLKDYPKAEQYYKEAIGASPSQSIDYLALFELYRYSYKQNTTAAADTLKAGIEKVPAPTVIDLYVALASYQADKGDKTEAIANYSKARDLARQAGNTRLVAQLDAAIKALQQ